MKVHYQPKTFLVSAPQLRLKAVAEMLDWSYGLDQDAWRRSSKDTDPESVCELMGRLCYGSWGKRQGRVGSSEYLGHILEQGHGSVLEHACWGFVVCGASRGFTHQMVRHRAGFGYSQESTHFIVYAADSAEVCLTGLPDDPELRTGAEASARASVEGYAAAWPLIDVPGETRTQKQKATCAAARGLLPTCLQSRLGFTANARALRHFLALRGDVANVPEIRVVAKQVLDLLLVEASGIFGDFVESVGDDGFPVLSCKYHKV